MHIDRTRVITEIFPLNRKKALFPTCEVKYNYGMFIFIEQEEAAVKICVLETSKYCEKSPLLATTTVVHT